MQQPEPTGEDGAPAGLFSLKGKIMDLLDEFNKIIGKI